MIDTTNKFLVANAPEGVFIGGTLTRYLKPADALLLAAYLVALSGEPKEEFLRVLEAVEST